ncbi:MAG: hypothetical protein ACKVT2_00170 [Saprospiraceae bacterium]
MQKLIVFFLFLAAQHARAQDCQSFIQDLIAHARKPNAYVSFKLVALGTNNKGLNWGQYAEGTLRPYGSTDPLVVGPSGLVGDATQYFSDREEQYCDCNKTPTPHSFANPNAKCWFHKGNPDLLGVNINLPGTFLGETTTCATPVTLTLKSWGNGKSKFCPTCVGKFMYLLDNGMVLIFEKGTGSIPPN